MKIRIDCTDNVTNLCLIISGIIKQKQIIIDS